MDSKSDSFKALQKEWYGKLKASGFEDVEYDEDHLRMHHADLIAGACKTGPAAAEAKAEYFRLAGHFLHSHEFTTPEDKRIWELHAEGLFNHEVFAQVKESHPGKTPRYVQSVVVRLRKVMLQKWNQRT